jgi:hypothetical protein
MLRGGIASLDYFRLVTSAKRLDPANYQRTVPFGILGDCATQQISTLIRVLSHLQGINAEIHDAGLGTIETEIFNPAPSLLCVQARGHRSAQHSERAKGAVPGPRR